MVEVEEASLTLAPQLYEPPNQYLLEDALVSTK